MSLKFEVLMSTLFHTGLDIGSTTVKAAVINSQGQSCLSVYRRHLSDVRQTVVGLIRELAAKLGSAPTTLAVTGSGGIAVANWLKSAFVQEVMAGAEAIRAYLPRTDVAIELGGEDAKITFFDAGIDQRMNETCAGGTGAFIDQMAAFLRTDPAGLNELAKNYATLYPLAARCGVFAKSDILPLLNEGAAQADIAASIFQAVVDQTIGGLACGRPIRGRVAFLGGPLFFLSELRKRFVETLRLPPGQARCPAEAQYFVALGAALMSRPEKPVTFAWLAELAGELEHLVIPPEIPPLPPLFENLGDLGRFQERHRQAALERADWPVGGQVFLGLDAGSTTTKAVAIDERGRLVFSHYGPNQGNPVQSVISVLRELYAVKPAAARIAYSGVTGYGEALLQAALGVDLGEVETVAHYKAAAFFAPGVSFIVDIGGQDIKCLSIKNGVIDRLMLNEACSSGCGSFIENFARNLGLEAPQFAQMALTAARPVDLGSRCTVFMNSKVKQAQKEGVSVGDISAGLSYSVIRNALYKVIKISQTDEFGPQVVVQGGTFFNDAILRAFELMTGLQAVRPDIAGLMGAFGAALLAKEAFEEKPALTGLIPAEKLASFTVETKSARCRQCPNHCLLTINRFSDGHRFISGNRCQRGAEAGKTPAAGRLSLHSLAKLPELARPTQRLVEHLPNLYQWKEERLFNFHRPLEEPRRGVVGLPRALNFYELYPFWFTFFTELGFRVELSPPSSKELFNLGLETMPSQTVCYPAKLVHGHIAALAAQGVDFIFYPALPFELAAPHKTNNRYNCPVVGGYPEVIRLNLDMLKERELPLIAPFLDLASPRKLAARLRRELAFLGLPRGGLIKALKKAYQAQAAYKKDLKKAGERALQYLRQSGRPGVVLTGHPYHIDPEVHHGIPGLIAANGLAVLSEDSISHLAPPETSFRVVDQWIYHSHMYRAALVAARSPELELIQLTSFGCGLDAVTADQVREIIEAAGKVYTLLKIDEGANLGAARIRVRSLLAAIRARRRLPVKPAQAYCYQPPRFTAAMARTHTILCPQMSPVHWQFMGPALAPFGYRLEVLPKVGRPAIEEGLRYVNNDACYPALVAIGQTIEALKSGGYDLNKTAVIMSQTGGGCRATNYVALLRKALAAAGLGQVPVAPLGLVQTEQSGLKLTRPLLSGMLQAMLYGDLLNRLLLASRPYEKRPGQALDLFRHWSARISRAAGRVDEQLFRDQAREMVKDFSQLNLEEPQKPKVGLVGEILVKFHPDANNQAVAVIEAEGGEAVAPDLANFMLYCLFDDIARADLLAGPWWKKMLSGWVIKQIEKKRDFMRAALSQAPRFGRIAAINHLAALAQKLVSLANQTGEGWLLTAEMIELLESGAGNIMCLQPFGCLPNHITGKGVIKELKRRYPEANVAAVDYDPGASEVNQLNRIKLMMSVAKQNAAAAEPLSHRPGAFGPPGIEA